MTTGVRICDHTNKPCPARCNAWHFPCIDEPEPAKKIRGVKTNLVLSTVIAMTVIVTLAALFS